MKRAIRFLINGFIAFMAPYQWLRMVFQVRDGVLSSSGFGSLKYFTVLSNLFCAAACLLWMFERVFRKQTRLSEMVKFSGTVSVGLTFVTVLVFLGPLYGYDAMYDGSNFWLHLVLPLLAAGEFVLMNERDFSPRHMVLSALPMPAYGMYYVINNLLSGIQQGDWYGFLRWGYPLGVLIFLLIFFITCLLSWLLWKGNAAVQSKISPYSRTEGSL